MYSGINDCKTLTLTLNLQQTYQIGACEEKKKGIAFWLVVLVEISWHTCNNDSLKRVMSGKSIDSHGYNLKFKKKSNEEVYTVNDSIITAGKEELKDLLQ